MVSVWDEYLSLRQALTDIGVEEAELEARELTAFALQEQTREIRRWREMPLDEQTRVQMHTLFERRKQEEPLAYILGEWDFYGNRFIVTPDVLIPRGDTEWLCDAAVQAAKQQPKPKILDLCCGSGCIGLSMALAVPQAQVTLIDCSEQALAVTRRNAALHSLSEPRVTIAQGDALRPDSIHDIPCAGRRYLPGFLFCKTTLPGRLREEVLLRSQVPCFKRRSAGEDPKRRVNPGKQQKSLFTLLFQVI